MGRDMHSLKNLFWLIYRLDYIPIPHIPATNLSKRKSLWFHLDLGSNPNVRHGIIAKREYAKPLNKMYNKIS